MPCDISVPYITGTTTQNMTCIIVSRGGMGWLPGVELPDPDLSILPRLMAPQTGSLNMQTVSNGVLRRMWYNPSTSALSILNPYCEQAPRTDRRGGVAYDVHNKYLQVNANTLYLCIEPAIGYGAGGGGWYAATGGNAGEVKLASVTLANTASISVTVGNGGTGGYTYYYSSGARRVEAYGGGGARGCVAVFW